MAERIPTRTGVAGFVVTEPQLQYTASGRARLYLRFGVGHFVAQGDGTFAPAPPTFHDLVAWEEVAEQVDALGLRPGDHFVAVGRVRERVRVVDGVEVTTLQFVAKQLGPDVTRHSVVVVRGSTGDGARAGRSDTAAGGDAS